MIDQSLARPARPSTRELRALALFEERGAEIRRTGPGTYLVPSATGRGAYLVDYRGETCTCPDHEHGHATCLHIYAVGILNAKRRGARPSPCSGCGAAFPRRETVEVGPEMAAHAHGVLEGERYCRACARRHGVL